MSLVYGSVCSGIEAATVAWHPLGWQPAFFSEIEKFPSAVLAHYYPSTPNHGDMTNFQEWPDAALDVLVGGTPCQSFSVAGLRKGLDDPRGNLMLTFGAIAQRYRPAWVVWENVPGVLSSNGGRDFGTFLGMLGQLGYGFAYRVLDAQYFGVAQRRRRVFVVGHLGDWRLAAAVLFERESMSGNYPPRREKAQSVANCLGVSPASSSSPNVGNGQGNIVSATVTSKWAKGSGGPAGDECSNLISAGRVFPTIDRMMDAKFGSNQWVNSGQFVLDQVVRRLTPVECERLQGFPDNYTLLPGKTADGPRYKALGNSMAVPVMRWIGERISQAESIP